MFSFVNYLFKAFAHFLIRFFVSFLSSCRNSLNIVDMGHL